MNYIIKIYFPFVSLCRFRVTDTYTEDLTVQLVFLIVTRKLHGTFYRTVL
jgi:hypothetical protein